MKKSEIRKERWMILIGTILYSIWILMIVGFYLASKQLFIIDNFSFNDFTIFSVLMFLTGWITKTFSQMIVEEYCIREE